MDFSNTLIRCSSIGKIMTEGRGKSNRQKYDEAKGMLDRCNSEYAILANKQTKTAANKYAKITELEAIVAALEPIKDSYELGATCTSYLKQLYREIKYNRRRDYTSKSIEKGVRQEEDAITLVALTRGVMLRKNKDRINNAFFSGEPDTYTGKSLIGTKHGYDTKCSWDIHTFPFEDDKLNPMYRWQNLGYIDLTGADAWTTSYCLVNATGQMITKEKERLWYALGCPDDTDDRYMEKRIEIEKNMIFDMEQFRKDNPGFEHDVRDWRYDIPMDERIIEFTVERNEDEIKEAKEQVIRCREWMDKTYNKPSVLLATRKDDITIISAA